MAVAVGSMTLPANVAVAGGGLSTRTLWANCESWFYYEKCMKGEDKGKERKGKERKGRERKRKEDLKEGKIEKRGGKLTIKEKERKRGRRRVIPYFIFQV